MSTRVTATTAGEAYRVDIEAGGHALVANEPPALGGANAGVSPYGLVLSGLAACTGITLRMYAVRKGWTDVRLRIDLALELAETRHTIRRRVEVIGAPDEAALARLRDIVERTPVTLALKAGFEIVTKLDAASA